MGFISSHNSALISFVSSLVIFTRITAVARYLKLLTISVSWSVIVNISFLFFLFCTNAFVSFFGH